MSDSSPFRRAGSTELPPSTIYDPADDQSTPFGAEPTGTVVLLLVGEVEGRWAAETALELSSTWARNGRRIVLVDLHLENPVLHELAGIENLEGVVDVFLYGASISRSARPVRGRGLYLIPAGTYTADLDAIYRHARWPKLVAGFRDANASLVLFVPTEGASPELLAQWASQVILLGTPRDPSVVERLRVQGCEVRGLIVPPSEEVRHVAEPAPAAPPAPSRAPRSEPVEEPMHLPPPPARAADRSHRLVTLLLVTLVLAILGGAGYVLAIVRPDLVPAWLGSAAEAGRDTASVVPRRVAAPIPAPRAVGEALPYSVQVINYQALDAAQSQLQRVREKNGETLFFISPEENQGILYFRILAGALPDSTSARELKQRLVANGSILEEDAAGAWALIQPTPQAFDLGEYRTEEEARAATDSLLARKIPAYALEVPYSDRTRRWQLYGGAYPDSASAEGMRKLLSASGVFTRLVPRTGSTGAEQP